MDVTIGCYQVHGTLDADVTIGCYYDDYSSCDYTIPTSLFIWNKNFSLTLVCLVFQLASKTSELSHVRVQLRFQIRTYVCV